MTERIFAVAHYADQMVLVLLLILCVVSVGLIVERYFVLKKATSRSAASRLQIEEALRTGDLGLIRQVASNEDSIEKKAYELTRDRMLAGETEGIHEIFASVGALERTKLEKSLPFLATVGSNAPYIGLFGTVLGIMKAFHDMAQATNGQSTVMAGISAALIATAAGLLVAIPSVLAYNFYQRQVKMVLSNLDTFRDVLIAWIKTNRGQDGSIKPS
jgi:biopolymer transport protein ExbB